MKVSELIMNLARKIEYDGDSKVEVRILTRDKFGGTSAVIKVQLARVTYVNLTQKKDTVFLCVEEDEIKQEQQ